MTEILQGDLVRCKVGYYKSYGRGAITTVKRLDISNAGNPVLILANSLTDYGESMYDVNNWEFVSRPKPKKEQTVGFSRTLYFGGKIEGMDTTELREIPRIGSRTVGRHSKHEAINDVRGVIQEGETWLLLQTVGIITPKEPERELAKVNIVECR